MRLIFFPPWFLVNTLLYSYPSFFTMTFLKPIFFWFL